MSDTALAIVIVGGVALLAGVAVLMGSAIHLRTGSGPVVVDEPTTYQPPVTEDVAEEVEVEVQTPAYTPVDAILETAVPAQRGYRGPHTHEYSVNNGDGYWRCGVHDPDDPNGPICNERGPLAGGI